MPHYEHAPIVEATIDLQVAYEALPVLGKFDELHQQFKERYTMRSELNFFEVQAGLNPEDSSKVQTKADHQKVGLRLSSADSSRVLQIQKRGFTFSHMAPYTKWEEFRSEARPLWAAFVESIKPKYVTRAALRYINRLDIPGARIELKDYFCLYPEIPKEVPQDVGGMFLQLLMPQTDISKTAVATISLALTPPVKPDTVAVILDLDLYQQGAWEPRDEAIWEFLEQVRKRKNELFEACITDRARGLFE